MRSRPRSWNSLLTALGFRPKKQRTAFDRTGPSRLRIEQCEDRRMLATFTVNVTYDQLPADFDNQDGITTLREAIFLANATAGPDQIDFSTDPADALDGATINLGRDENYNHIVGLTGESGQLTIGEHSLTIDGSSLPQGISIDAKGTDTKATPERGDGDGSRVFYISIPSFFAGPREVVFKGLTITGGDPNGDNGRGGAIFFAHDINTVDSPVSLSVQHSKITGNDATDGGSGGIFARTEYGKITISDTLIADNTASGSGGGVHVVMGSHETGFAELEIIRTVIENNESGNRGGGIFIESASHATRIVESTITGNDAGLALTGLQNAGGGIYAALRNDNTGYYEEGYIEGYFLPRLFIEGVEISDNKAGEAGGGIAVLTTSTQNGEETRLGVVNTTISGNTAGNPQTSALGQGGGVHLLMSDEDFSNDQQLISRFHNTTITKNRADEGAGIWSENEDDIGPSEINDAALLNSILSENTDHNLNANNAFGSFNLLNTAYNLIGSGNSIFQHNDPDNIPTDFNSGLGNILSDDPELDPLDDYGGFNRTHRPIFTGDPLTNSPVIDAGVNGFAIRPFHPTEPEELYFLEYDQRGIGFPRYFDSQTGAIGRTTSAIVDMGAFEVLRWGNSTFLPGDYDKDEDVDGSDFLVWLSTFGDSVANEDDSIEKPYDGADGDGNGVVDANDLFVWRANYGATATSPPPQTLALVAGDYNFDGTVDSDDYLVWFSNLGSTTNLDADGNENGVIDAGDLSILQQTFMITTLDVLPGDFNDNGVVDTADYDLWDAGDSTADADGDGDVDQDDYDIWLDNFGLTNVANLPLIIGNTSGMPLDIPMAAPRVLDFEISGSASSDPAYSFSPVVGSGEQLRTVPVSGADTVSIRFNEEVFVTENALQVVNLDGSIPASVTNFTYDLDTQTASWQFDSSFADGRHLFVLDDSVIDLDHDLLDGEFTNPLSLSYTTSDTFTTGNGREGGEFRFRATILANDTNRDNIDGTTDYTDWLSFEPGRIYVTTETDEVDTDYSIGDMSLREAVIEANLATGPTTIVLPRGRYSLTRTGIEGTNDVNFNDLDVTGDLTIVGDGAGMSIIDSTSLTGLDGRALHVDTSTAKLRLDKLTIG